MNELQILSKTISTKRGVTNDQYNMVFEYKNTDGQIPEVVTCRAVSVNEDTPQHSLDVAYWPATNNLTITAHHTPNDFDAANINPILGYIYAIFEEISNA